MALAISNAYRAWTLHVLLMIRKNSSLCIHCLNTDRHRVDSFDASEIFAFEACDEFCDALEIGGIF